MKQIQSILAFLLLVMIQTACSADPELQPKVSDQMVLEAGQILTATTFQTLSGQLSQAIEEGGVPHALEFCSVEAIPLTENVSQEFDVQIRRASHKPRNPQNRATEVELSVIDTYIEALENALDLTPQILREDDRIHYFAPIRIGLNSCIQCHGNPETDIDQEHLSLIRSLYPGDEATGFSMGDLRGIWSISLPADSISVQKIIEMLE